MATLRSHEISASVDILVTDLVSGLLPRLRGAVDFLIFNPPYVPTPDEEVERGGIAAAWAGGYRGRKVIDRVLPLVPELLSPQGQFLMVTVPDNDPQGKIYNANSLFYIILAASFHPLVKGMLGITAPCLNSYINKRSPLPAELIEILSKDGFSGKVIATRAADEELLQIVHFWRIDKDKEDTGHLDSIPTQLN